MAAQKVALITAGSAGLGAQIARVLAPDFRVVFNYSSNTQRADSLLSELSSIPSDPRAPSPASPRFHKIQADVTSQSEIKRLVSEALEIMGQIDVVVSNHGWTRMTDFKNLDEAMVEEDWDKCFLYNVKSHLWLMHALKLELEKREGAFVSTASVAGVKPSGSSVAYAVSKAAQIHLAKSLAIICSPKIRVNSVSPGMMMTEWGQKFPESKKQAAINNTKLKRLATVEDVANQVRTLVLSQSATGQNLCIDGGSSV